MRRTRRSLRGSAQGSKEIGVTENVHSIRDFHVFYLFSVIFFSRIIIGRATNDQDASRYVTVLYILY